MRKIQKTLIYVNSIRTPPELHQNSIKCTRCLFPHIVCQPTHICNECSRLTPARCSGWSLAWQCRVGWRPHKPANNFCINVCTKVFTHRWQHIMTLGCGNLPVAAREQIRRGLPVGCANAGRLPVLSGAPNDWRQDRDNLQLDWQTEGQQEHSTT